MDFLNIRVYSLVVLMLVSSGGGYRPPQQKARCKYAHTFRKITADCIGLDLSEIPNDLKHDIEILDASDNRIREIHNESLMRYSSLQLLYLSNNFITYIEPGAFMSLPELQVLDLSVNGIRSMPSELPLTLRKLYLNGNRDLETVPLTKAFNLEFLSLADCHLSALPDVGQLPYLIELNITGNPISTISAEQLAPLCRLKHLHVSGNLFQNKRDKDQTVDCKCHELVYWTKKWSIQTKSPINCTELGERDYELCLSNRSTWLEMRQECLSRTPPFSLTSTGVMTSIGIALLVIVLLALCCVWRRSRRKRNSVKQQQNHHLNHAHPKMSENLESSPKKSTVV